MPKNNSLGSFYFLYLVYFIFIFMLIPPSYASKNNSNNNVTQLVNDVCAKTSNYTFCVESLYSDPHTPKSDQYGLAYVAFGLAYTNATSTKEYIAKLLKKKDISSHYYRLLLLQRCENDYRRAVSAIENAYNDLNSETFYELADLAGVASHGAADCQEALKGTSHNYLPMLEFMNNALKGLCKICVVIAKLFTG